MCWNISTRLLMGVKPNPVGIGDEQRITGESNSTRAAEQRIRSARVLRCERSLADH